MKLFPFLSPLFAVLNSLAAPDGGCITTCLCCRCSLLACRVRVLFAASPTLLAFEGINSPPSHRQLVTPLSFAGLLSSLSDESMDEGSSEDRCAPESWSCVQPPPPPPVHHHHHSRQDSNNLPGSVIKPRGYVESVREGVRSREGKGPSSSEIVTSAQANRWWSDTDGFDFEQAYLRDLQADDMKTEGALVFGAWNTRADARLLFVSCFTNLPFSRSRAIHLSPFKT